jgi:hypothetical protein
MTAEPAEVIKIRRGRQSRLPRWMHHAYAKLAGYFWLRCPLCGQFCGGHEWRDIGGKPSSIANPEGGTGFIGICPACTRQGLGD